MAFKDKQAMYDYNNKFQAEKYDRIQVLAKKETGKAIRDAAAADGKSVSAYILEAVQMRMDDTLHNDRESTMCNDSMPHDSDTEALPDLLTPYARQLADDASKAAGVEVKNWIERTLAARAAAEADGRRFIKEANERIAKKE